MSRYISVRSRQQSKDVRVKERERDGDVHDVGSRRASKESVKGEYRDTRSMSRKPSKSSTRLDIPRNVTLSLARSYFRLKHLEVSDFDFLATVGKGTFGRVNIVTLKESISKRILRDGCPPLPTLAIKMMKKNEILQQEQIGHIKAEVNILSNLDHPFIIDLYGVMHDKYRLYLIMEYVNGGELFNLLAKFDKFSIEHARFYASEVILAFEYLHSMSIAYRDLKPENLLIDGTGHIKVADFGFAKKIIKRTWTLCGTPEYLAPEVIVQQGHGCAVDWWGLGVLIFEMLTGFPPFAADDALSIYRLIQEVRFTFPRTMDIRGKDLIRRLLVKDISRRYGCLKTGAEDIKRHKFFKGLNWQDVMDKNTPPPWVPTMDPEDEPNKYFDTYSDSDQEPPLITPAAEKEHFDCFNHWVDEGEV